MKSNLLPVIPLLLLLLLAPGCSGGENAETVSDPASEQSAEYTRLKDEALALRNTGDLPGAVQKISRALAAAPLERDPYQIASGFYMEMVNDIEAARFFDITTRMAPRSPWAWYYRGFHQFRSGLWDDALASFREASLIEPDYWEFHFRQGLVLQAAGEFDPALVELKLAMELEPGSALVAARLIRILRITGNLRDAERVLTAVLSKTALTADLAFATGQIRSNQDRADEAELAYREAIRLDPTHLEAHQNLARLLAAAGQHDAAARETAISNRLRDYRDGIESWTAEAAGSTDPLPSVAIAELHLTEGRIDEAMNWFGRAQAMNGPLDRIHIGRAEALFNRGDTSGGDMELAQLQKVSGGRFALARAARFLSTGDSASAIDQLAKAVQSGPGDREFLRRAGDLYAAAGDTEKAVVVHLQASGAARVHTPAVKETSR